MREKDESVTVSGVGWMELGCVGPPASSNPAPRAMAATPPAGVQDAHVCSPSQQRRHRPCSVLMNRAA